MLIGDRIKQLRLDAKMTQPELAEKIHISRSTVAAYENNTRQPSFHILGRLSHVFNVSTDYILLGDENNDSIDVSGLSGEQRMIIANLIKNFKETNEIIRYNTRDRKAIIHENKKLSKKIDEISNKE